MATNYDPPQRGRWKNHVPQRVQQVPKRTSKRAASPPPTPPVPFKRIKRDYNEAFKVVVGPEGETELFNVHVAIATTKSSFFKAACSSKWMGKGVVQLPEEDPEVFRVFVHWLYTEQIDISTMHDPKRNASGGEFVVLGKLWALADYLGCVELRNKVIDTILRSLDDRGWDEIIYPGAMLLKIWDTTPAGSTIRRLFVDVFVGRFRRKNYDEWDVVDLPEEILQEATIRFLKGQGNGGTKGPGWKEREQYHEVEDEGKRKGKGLQVRANDDGSFTYVGD